MMGPPGGHAKRKRPKRNHFLRGIGVFLGAFFTQFPFDDICGVFLGCFWGERSFVPMTLIWGCFGGVLGRLFLF